MLASCDAEFGHAQHSDLGSMSSRIRRFASQQYALDPQAGKLCILADTDWFSSFLLIMACTFHFWAGNRGWDEGNVLVFRRGETSAGTTGGASNAAHRGDAHACPRGGPG